MKAQPWWRRLWFRVLRGLMLIAACKSADPLIRPTMSVEQRNPTVTPLAKVNPVDKNLARRTDGVSFTGLHFVPGLANAVLNARVTVAASAPEVNDLVVTVFCDQELVPVFHESRPIPLGGRAMIDATFQLRANGLQPLRLDCRVGPGRPGTIVFNGPSEYPPPVPLTGIEMWEGSRWLLQVVEFCRKLWRSGRT